MKLLRTNASEVRKEIGIRRVDRYGPRGRREVTLQESSEREHTHYLNARHSVSSNATAPSLSMRLYTPPFSFFVPLCLSYSHFLRHFSSPSSVRQVSRVFRVSIPTTVKWTIFDSSVLLGLDERREAAVRFFPRRGRF